MRFARGLRRLFDSYSGFTIELCVWLEEFDGFYSQKATQRMGIRPLDPRVNRVFVFHICIYIYIYTHVVVVALVVVVV